MRYLEEMAFDSFIVERSNRAAYDRAKLLAKESFIGIAALW